LDFGRRERKADLRLLIRRGAGPWAEPEISGHKSEDALQELLATSPDLLPGAETGLPLAVARELPVSAGRIDLVGVDVEGEVTLCECKLATNPGIRREVIGQLLEYASSLRGMSLSDFSERFAARAGVPLVEAVSGIAGEGFDQESFEQQVAENLAAGRFRLVIVVDRISDALRQTVLYLNEHLDRAVLALELAYLRDGEVEMLLPQIFGAESAERRRQPRTQTVADADTVVVAARHAYETYLSTGSYVCQPLRSFREQIRYLGFYKDKAIQPEVPLIRHRRKNVIFTRDEATRLRGSSDETDAEVAALIDTNLDSQQQSDGGAHQVFLLSPLESDKTLKLPRPIRHTQRGAWTQGQRYTASSALQRGPATTEDLAADGG
jgi:hypothetical protein